MKNNDLAQKMGRPEFKKKLTALIVSALVLILNDILDLGVSTETLTWLAGLVGTYMLGQGMADIGKERAIIQAASGMAEHMEIDIDTVNSDRGQGIGKIPYQQLGADGPVVKDKSPFEGRAFG